MNTRQQRRQCVCFSNRLANPMPTPTNPNPIANLLPAVRRWWQPVRRRPVGVPQMYGNAQIFRTSSCLKFRLPPRRLGETFGSFGAGRTGHVGHTVQFRQFPGVDIEASWECLMKNLPVAPGCRTDRVMDDTVEASSS